MNSGKCTVLLVLLPSRGPTSQPNTPNNHLHSIPLQCQDRPIQAGCGILLPTNLGAGHEVPAYGQAASQFLNQIMSNNSLLYP